MSKKVILNSSGDQPILVHLTSNSRMLMSISKNPAAHKPSDPSEQEDEGAEHWAPWGTSDDFPREIVKLIRKSTVGRSGLQRLVKSIYGQRVITYKVVDMNEAGREVIQYVREPALQDILARSNFNLVRLALTQDYSFLGIAFVELIFTADKSKVHSVYFHKASHCRLAKIDSKTGKIPHVYVSGNFPDVEVKDCQKLPLIDLLDFPNQIDQIRQDKKNFKYIMPLYWPDPLNDYYPVVFWDSARESGWLDIAVSIPAYKKALFTNQMSIKYHVDIPMTYFELKYKDWHTKTQQERDIIFNNLYDELNDHLTGAANAKKALISFSSQDRAGNSTKWNLDVVDDKMRSDAYLPDASAANSEILFAMGINPAVSGQGNTGGSYSGGANNGGSNIRESALDLRSQLRADRDLLLGWFSFLKLYNGLDPELEMGIQDQVLTTLDTGRGTEKVVS